MDNITTLELVIVVFAMEFVGFLAALAASESVEETRGKDQSFTTWVVFVIVNGIMGALFKVAHPAVYAVVLVILAGLQLVNLEGKRRRQSWNILSIAYAILLILSVVYHRGSGFRWTMLFWLIPAVLPFITGAVQAIRLNQKGKTKKERTETDSIELRGHVISWTIVAALIVTFIVLALI